MHIFPNHAALSEVLQMNIAVEVLFFPFSFLFFLINPDIMPWHDVRVIFSHKGGVVLKVFKQLFASSSASQCQITKRLPDDSVLDSRIW